MVEASELRERISVSRQVLESIKFILQYQDKSSRLQELEHQIAQPDAWQDQDNYQKLNQDRSNLSKTVETISHLDISLQNCHELLELAISEQDADCLLEVDSDLQALSKKLTLLEHSCLFSGEQDGSNAYLDIQSGSGGTEAQDWALMLERMYLRWCDEHQFRVKITERSEGEVAGIKSVTLHVQGADAFGWLRTESGVHRLVRKSPFDSGSRRHTSFASVFVSPEIDDSVQVEIDPSQVRIDTYRSSGAGGQHVNKTDSAVRLTHEPTGAVVQCQSDRSQHKNKEIAWKQLRAKLYELELQKKRQEADKVEASKSDISWGSQIRSYVLDDARIKDLRTGIENRNTRIVLDGNLDDFIIASLKQRV